MSKKQFSSIKEIVKFDLEKFPDNSFNLIDIEKNEDGKLLYSFYKEIDFLIHGLFNEIELFIFENKNMWVELKNSEYKKVNKILFQRFLDNLVDIYGKDKTGNGKFSSLEQAGSNARRRWDECFLTMEDGKEISEITFGINHLKSKSSIDLKSLKLLEITEDIDGLISKPQQKQPKSTNFLQRLFYLIIYFFKRKPKEKIIEFQTHQEKRTNKFAVVDFSNIIKLQKSITSNEILKLFGKPDEQKESDEETYIAYKYGGQEYLKIELDNNENLLKGVDIQGISSPYYMENVTDFNTVIEYFNHIGIDDPKLTLLGKTRSELKSMILSSNFEEDNDFIQYNSSDDSFYVSFAFYGGEQCEGINLNFW